MQVNIWGDARYACVIMTNTVRKGQYSTNSDRKLLYELIAEHPDILNVRNHNSAFYMDFERLAKEGKIRVTHPNPRKALAAALRSESTKEREMLSEATIPARGPHSNGRLLFEGMPTLKAVLREGSPKVRVIVAEALESSSRLSI